MYPSTDSWRGGEKKANYKKQEMKMPTDISMNEYQDTGISQSGNIFNRIKKKSKVFEDTEMINQEEEILEDNIKTYSQEKEQRKRVKKSEKEIDPDWLPYEQKTKFNKKKLGGRKEQAIKSKDTMTVSESKEVPPKITIDLSKGKIIFIF
jgi:hypothetical protein